VTTDGQDPKDRDRFLKAAAGFTPLVAVTSGDATFIVSTSGEQVGRTLFIKGERNEMETLDQAVDVLVELLGEDAVSGKAFVDVGANIGTSTITALLSHSFARAIACEPEPTNYRLLRLNIAINDLEGRVETLPVAVSLEEGTALLHLSSSNSGAHRVVSGSMTARRRAPGKVLSVEKVRLDALVKRGFFRPEEVGLLWIDAQGHEGHVLAGASSLVERGTPIVLEFHPGMLDRAGGRKAAQRTIADHYTHFVDLRHIWDGTTPRLWAADDILGFSRGFGMNRGTPRFTDLLVLRQPQGAAWEVTARPPEAARRRANRRKVTT
jgi:FkbM family methyltransferase